MGAGTNFRHPMAWQATLGGMQANGTLAYQVCSKCKLRRDVDVAALVDKEGPRSTLWDRRPICPRCGERTHYMASPGPGTPFRPMLSGMLYDEARRQFFRALGLTRRDVTRIRAMAEATVPGQLPRELADLDVPIRVTARFLEPLSGSELADRKSMAAAAQQRIAGALALPRALSESPLIA